MNKVIEKNKDLELIIIKEKELKAYEKIYGSFV